MCNRDLVIERLAECIAIAEKHFNQTFKMPRIRFDKRGGVAGTATGSKWEVNFNETLLNENVDAFIHRTVAHELAHLIDFQVYDSQALRFDRNGRRKKRTPHGTNWKNIMAILGVESSRCHTYDTSNSRVSRRRKSETFEYHCSGCNKTLPMGKIRHNKQQSGMAVYTHCRGHKLTFIG